MALTETEAPEPLQTGQPYDNPSGIRNARESYLRFAGVMKAAGSNKTILGIMQDEIRSRVKPEMPGMGNLPATQSVLDKMTGSSEPIEEMDATDERRDERMISCLAALDVIVEGGMCVAPESGANNPCIRYAAAIIALQNEVIGTDVTITSGIPE